MVADDFRINTQQVRNVANNEVSEIATALGEMATYAKESKLAKGHFGNISGLSNQAEAYVEKYAQLADSLGKAAAFAKQYAEILHESVKMRNLNEAQHSETLGKIGGV